ncbi:MAG: hypothetical protein ABFD44_15200 [Anaerolineaceae bacterium]
MKTSQNKMLLFSFILIMSLVLTTFNVQAAPALQATGTPYPATATPTSTVTRTPTATRAPVATVAPTATPGVTQSTSAERPVVLMQSYTVDKETIRPGDDFNLIVKLVNTGANAANNVIVTFTSGDLIPRSNGGIVSVSKISTNGDVKSITQPLTASTALIPGAIANMTVGISYVDSESGTEYSASFAVSLRIGSYSGSGAAGPTRTPTPVTIQRPQLVISSYTTDVDPLQPGSPFNLHLEVRNLGNINARSITMVLGGGATINMDASGTPVPGGSAGGTSGDFTNFAPLGSSNLIFLGDLKSGDTVSADQKVIVNTTTQPGAYSVKFAFVYSDEKGVRYVDDQVITLLVYRLPQVEMGFYRQPDPLYAGQPGVLPVQIVNLARTSTVLGTMKAAAQNADLTNNSTLVGTLDPGMFYPLDVSIVPMQAGPLEIEVSINFTDDFNQVQTITQKLTVDVMEAAPIEEPQLGPDGMPLNPSDGTGVIDVSTAQPETFWQKIGRFFKGLLGLDSGVKEETLPADGSATPEEVKPGIINSAPPTKGG